MTGDGEREPLEAEVPGGTLGGWVAGEGLPVVLLHGGPGLGYEYMDGLAVELLDGFRVASFQQRGLAPSTLEGPFTIAQAIDDVLAVLDALGWERALLVGHSWGGYLALWVAAKYPDRLLGVLAVDPLGIVGDGGMAAFSAEILARTPAAGRERVRELDERAEAGEASAEEHAEAHTIIWPAYFADPERVMPEPESRVSVEANFGLVSEIRQGSEEAARELASSEVRYGVVAGAGSPMPWGQSARATAELSPDAFLVVVPGAGHFLWFEAPGRVREALERLIA